MLQEQRKINEELMGQMRQMQMSMQDMKRGFGGSSGGGGGNGPSSSRGGPWSDDFGDFGGFGSGYGDGFGGGKMFQSQFMSGRGVPYNTRVAKHEGDWDCPSCGNMNFARRMTCNGSNCNVEKRPEFVRRGQEIMKGGPKTKMPGDWDCPKCGNMNYGRRSECNTGCGFKKSDLRNSGMGFGNMGGGMMGGMGSNDWECPKCNNLNYARRDRCNRKDCDFEKKDLDDFGSRMGMGNFGSMGGMFGMDPEPGQWECPRCKNMNFNNREVCNGKMDGELCNLQKPDFEKWSVRPVKTQESRRPGDWDCWRCGNINFKIRESCNKCGVSMEEAQDENLRETPGGID